MPARTNIAAVASLIAEPTRATILDALLTGDPLPAGELARRAGIAPSTASGHLARLLEGRIVICEQTGRERRYRLASPAVAEALEALAQIAPALPVHSLRGADRQAALKFARTCYDHLAGHLGVTLTESFVARRILKPGDGTYALTKQGERVLSDVGVDLEHAQSLRRPFARSCLDWSERRPHLAGGLGAAVCDAFLRQKVVLRRPNDRALTVTPQGVAFLQQIGVSL